MAKKRRRRKNKNGKHKSIKSMIRQVVNKGSAPLAFWQQLSEKDYQVLNATTEYRSLDYLGKLKVASNILTGSLTGRVLFSDQYNPSPSGQPRINPAGIINKWTGIGVAGKIYGVIGKSMKLPESATIDRIGSKLIFGGGIGGFFDPPSAQGRISTYAVTPNVMVQNRSQTDRSYAVARRNRGFVPLDSFDYSTGSAFRR
tara:strand:- start:171 stop:770 length:600 start_codon:yes stop_codon:yes gene_type:complete